MKRFAIAVAAILAMGTLAAADDTDTRTTEPVDTRPHVKVLNDPKDIASFYRSSSSGSSFHYEPYAYGGYARRGGSPYQLAGFYRNGDTGSRYYFGFVGPREFRSRGVSPLIVLRPRTGRQHQHQHEHH